MTDRVDIYIRLNEDPDKDYCLSVAKDTQIRDLRKLFATIPVLLSPNYFHAAIPTGFKVSAHPGHLTQEGGLLFDWNADCEEHLLDLNQFDTVGEALVPGCLVVPTWEFKPLRYYGILSALLFWWYLDWPDWLSPTPGHQPTVMLGNWLAKYSELIRQELAHGNVFEGLHWDWLFFILHTIKVAIIWLVFRVGILNFFTLNPFAKHPGPNQKITPELLMDLGWTSVRRMQPDDWNQKHRDNLIQQYDGAIVKAYASGRLNTLASLALKQGEGWSVLRTQRAIEKVKVGKDLLDENGNFPLSLQYLQALSSHSRTLMQAAAEASSETNLAPLEQAAKDIRQFGFMNGPQELREMFLKLEQERNPKKLKTT